LPTKLRYHSPQAIVVGILNDFYFQTCLIKLSFKMRTYDDTFSGTKIYPGKVGSPSQKNNPLIIEVLVIRPQNLVRPLADVYLSPQGKLYVRGDSKIFRFQNGKTESLFLQRKNPRRIAWTTLYRRMHKKGISEVSTFCMFTYITGHRPCRL
jgi:ribosomal protein L24E